MTSSLLNIKPYLFILPSLLCPALYCLFRYGVDREESRRDANRAGYHPMGETDIKHQWNFIYRLQIPY